MVQIIAIEGNIGVGKSTFTRILKERIPSSELVSEPVDMWMNIKNNDNKNILQMFYDDIPRWAYTFQNIAYLTRMIKIEDAIRNTNCNYMFLDRSLGTDKHVFEAMLHDNGQLVEIEHVAYNMWADFYTKYVRSDVGKQIIYLRAQPETCATRIKIRGREEEKNISLSYLERLHKYHDDWLLNNPNCLVIDCDRDFENDINYQNDIIEKINKLLLID